MPDPDRALWFIMLELNKPIHVDDPLRLLQYERGLFEIISPDGECLHVNAPLTHLPLPPEKQLPAPKPVRGWWRIQKIAHR